MVRKETVIELCYIIINDNNHDYKTKNYIENLKTLARSDDPKYVNNFSGFVNIISFTILYYELLGRVSNIELVVRKVDKYPNKEYKWIPLWSCVKGLSIPFEYNYNVGKSKKKRLIDSNSFEDWSVFDEFQNGNTNFSTSPNSSETPKNFTNTEKENAGKKFLKQLISVFCHQHILKEINPVAITFKYNQDKEFQNMRVKMYTQHPQGISTNYGYRENIQAQIHSLKTSKSTKKLFQTYLKCPDRKERINIKYVNGLQNKERGNYKRGGRGRGRGYRRRY